MEGGLEGEILDFRVGACFALFKFQLEIVCVRAHACVHVYT